MPVYLSWLEQSTGNRKNRTRTPAQSDASLFPQKDFKFFKIIQLFPSFKSLKLSARTPVGEVSYLIPTLVAS